MPQHPAVAIVGVLARQQANRLFFQQLRQLVFGGFRQRLRSLAAMSHLRGVDAHQPDPTAIHQPHGITVIDLFHLHGFHRHVGVQRA